MLPLPIASLVRRARNAKSPKERHDTAFFAWEASIRLAVAAAPRAAPGALGLPSTGHWVNATHWPEGPFDHPALLAAFRLWSDAQGRASSPSAVSGATLLEPFAAYRNAVMGHGAVRSAEFYDASGATLLEGLSAAWASHFFWPPDAALVFVEGISTDLTGQPRARVIHLASELASVEEGVSWVEKVLPGRLYLRTQARLDALHPWLLFQQTELRERVLFFNGRTRGGSQYLDYVSGDSLKGKGLREAFPTIEDDIATVPELRADPAQAPAAPDAASFGDFRILGKLGEGGMGVVFLARQESLGRLVALKLLPSSVSDDAIAVARFKREIAALARCDHPNVVKILSSGVRDGQHYYAMEFIEGADLSLLREALSTSDDFGSAVSSASSGVRKAKQDVFANVPNITRRSAGALHSLDRVRALTQLFRDAALAVAHLHSQGVIHRDIKPANLMVTEHDHRVVLMDLGLAAVADASKSLTRDKASVLGTLRYIAPEQLNRALVDLDQRADVYGLAATFYELFCGRPVHSGETESRLIHQILHGDIADPRKVSPRVSRGLATVLLRALSRDREDRHPTAEALAEDLDGLLSGRRIRGRTTRLRRRSYAAVSALALVAVAGFGLREALRPRWPEVSEARPQGTPAPQDAAIVIAIEKYHVVPTVPGATRNATDWMSWLRKGRGVPSERVRYLGDLDATRTRMLRDIRRAMETIPAGATLWFIFVGHGAPAMDGRDGVMITAEATQTPDGLYSASLAVGEVLKELATGQFERTVVIIDSCFSGRVGNGDSLLPGMQPLIAVRPVDVPQRFAVLTACRSDQFAGPLPGADRPAFSYLVLGALRGWGDGNGDQTVTLGEVLAYTRDVLQVVPGRTQTPTATGDLGMDVTLADGATERAELPFP